MTPHRIPRRQFPVASAAALGLAPMALLRAHSGSPNDEILMGVVVQSGANGFTHHGRLIGESKRSMEAYVAS